MDRITAATVFTEIVQHGSLTDAAEALDMSRAMVTRYLGAMEHWAGTRLLHRTTRKLSLTPAGEATLARCERLLDAAHDVPMLDDSATPAGLCRVAASESLTTCVLVKAVAAYQERYPHAVIDLQASDRTVDLVDDRIDLAIRTTHAVDEHLVARLLGHCPSVVCASPTYLERHGVPRDPDDLRQHRCLTHDYFGKSLWTFESRPGRPPISVPVSGPLSASSSSVLLAAALADVGITMQPVYAALPDLAAGRLVQLMPQDTPVQLGIYGVYGTRRQMTPLLRTLLDFLADWFAHAEADAAVPASQYAPLKPPRAA